MDASSAVAGAKVASAVSMAVAVKALDVFKEQGGAQVAMVEQAAAAAKVLAANPPGTGTLIDVTG